MEDQPRWKQGAWAYCLIAAPEDGVRTDYSSEQEQEKEEHMTSSQGRRGPAPRLLAKTVAKNTLWGASSHRLFCDHSPLSQTFNGNWYTPKPCCSSTLGNKARERLSQVPGVSEAAEARVTVEATAEKQAGTWPGSEQKSADFYPNVLGEAGLAGGGRVQILLFY